MEHLADRLLVSRHELPDRNGNAVLFEPGVGAPAYALAAVLDREAGDTIPDGPARGTGPFQAPCLARA